MNGYLFALVQVFIYFGLTGIEIAIRGDSGTVDISGQVINGLVYFFGIYTGVYYMSSKGGKV